MANAAVPWFLAGVEEVSLLQPPVNVLRLSLHPSGLASRIALPLQLRTPSGTLSLISTTTVFGTPVDLTLAELALETFFPADEASAEALRRLGA